MPDQGGISLLPEARRRLEITVPGENRPFYYGGAVLLLVVLIFAGLKFYTSYLTSSLTEIENEVALIESQRNREFEQEVLRLNKQFSLVGNILKGHLIWSNVISSVQSRTPPQIQIRTLLGDTTEAKLDISGRALNYTTVAKQIAALLSYESVTDVVLDKVSVFSSGFLEYNMRLYFDKDKFLLNQ